MFFGNYTYQIDEKGRLFVPAKYREELGEVFIAFMDGQNGCLICYSQSRCEDIMKKIEDMPYSERQEISDLFGNAAELSPDKQGRVIIPPEMRKWAVLDEKTEIFIKGVGKNIQIWNKTRHDDRMKNPYKPSETDLASKIPDNYGF